MTNKLYVFGTVDEVMRSFNEKLTDLEFRKSLVHSLISSVKILEGRCTEKDTAFEQQAVELAKAENQSQQYESRWKGAVSSNDDMHKKNRDLVGGLETTKESCKKLIDENESLESNRDHYKSIVEVHAVRITELRNDIDKHENADRDSIAFKLFKENKELTKHCSDFDLIKSGLDKAQGKLIAVIKVNEILNKSIKSTESALTYKDDVIRQCKKRAGIFKNALHEATGKDIQNL